MIKANLISEFDAAQLVKISPNLLRWFTSYSPKKDGRKLKSEVIEGVYYFDKKELLEFDSYLHLPWPKAPTAQRPTIPAGIALEVNTECFYRCPICNTTIGELAHIKAVSKSYDNHPHNLIYLCPDHHTLYDYGYKYYNIPEEDINAHKKARLSFQALLWDKQNKIVADYLSVINKIGRVLDLEKTIVNDLNQKNFEELFVSILKKIDKVKSKTAKSEKVVAIIESVNSKRTNDPRTDAINFLSVLPALKKEYSNDSGLVECSLCHSKGSTSYFEVCPACGGEGYVDKDITIDYSIYEIEDCPLCEGKGRTADFETCPPCHGDGTLTKEQIENIDFSIYEMEDCPLCEGKGRTTEFETCPPCHGEGKLTREQIDNIDFSIYEMEDCPLCEGKGRTAEFETCPPCHGEGKLTKQQIEDIDFGEF